MIKASEYLVRLLGGLHIFLAMQKKFCYFYSPTSCCGAAYPEEVRMEAKNVQNLPERNKETEYISDTGGMTSSSVSSRVAEVLIDSIDRAVGREITLSEYSRSYFS